MGYFSLAPIAFEGVSQTTQTNSVELGTRVTVSGTFSGISDEYVYCLNNTGSSVTQGALMIQSGASLSRSSTAALDFPMVGVKNTAVSAGAYFWGLARGYMRVMSIAVTKGDLLTVGADGAVQTFTVATFSTGPLIGKVGDTATAATQPGCFLKLFG